MYVQDLLNRHNMVFGNYRWTEFDEEFLRKNVESVAIVDLEEMITQVCCADSLSECFGSFFRKCDICLKL